MSNNADTFLNLICLGIGHDHHIQVNDVEWATVEELAKQQGLSAVMVDGVEKLPENKRPPKQLLLQWIGETLQGYEYRYESYCRAISEMSAFYKEHGIEMMVLKGFGCSLNWPKPEHRPCGDIDIWLFGKQRLADEVLSREKNVRIDSSHHHHTVFYWRGFMVENHYDFIHEARHKSHKGLESIFKELGEDKSNSIQLYGERVYLPSPNLHALFLVRHALNHFVSIGINIRQVLDWAFFVKKNTHEIDWGWLVSVFEQYKMMPFFNCLNAICVEDLGFSSSLFPVIQSVPSIKERILNDIVSTPYSSVTSQNNGLFFRFNRWVKSSWKQKYCYDESLLSSFWSGITEMLSRPASK